MCGYMREKVSMWGCAGGECVGVRGRILYHFVFVPLSAKPQQNFQQTT